MDKLRKKPVAEAVVKFKGLMQKHDIAFMQYSWDASFNGIDDYLLHNATQQKMVA